MSAFVTACLSLALFLDLGMRLVLAILSLVSHGQLARAIFSQTQWNGAVE